MTVHCNIEGTNSYSHCKYVVLVKLYSSKCIENWEFLNCFVT